MNPDEQRALAHLMYAMRQVYEQRVAAARAIRDRAVAEFNRDGTDMPQATRH
jgi:hypothetical protein